VRDAAEGHDPPDGEDCSAVLGKGAWGGTAAVRTRARETLHQQRTRVEGVGAWPRMLFRLPLLLVVSLSPITVVPLSLPHVVGVEMSMDEIYSLITRSFFRCLATEPCTGSRPSSTCRVRSTVRDVEPFYLFVSGRARPPSCRSLFGL